MPWILLGLSMIDNYWITELLNYTHYLAVKKQQNNESINDGVGIIGNRY